MELLIPNKCNETQVTDKISVRWGLTSLRKAWFSELVEDRSALCMRCSSSCLDLLGLWRIRDDFSTRPFLPLGNGPKGCTLSFVLAVPAPVVPITVAVPPVFGLTLRGLAVLLLPAPSNRKGKQMLLLHFFFFIHDIRNVKKVDLDWSGK